MRLLFCSLLLFMTDVLQLVCCDVFYLLIAPQWMSGWVSECGLEMAQTTKPLRKKRRVHLPRVPDINYTHTSKQISIYIRNISVQVQKHLNVIPTHFTNKNNYVFAFLITKTKSQFKLSHGSGCFIVVVYNLQYIKMFHMKHVQHTNNKLANICSNSNIHSYIL